MTEVLHDALSSIRGVRVVQIDAGTNLRPLSAWFRVDADAVKDVLPYLTEFVATNYRGHPFRLLLQDAGDGGHIGPVGTLVMCLESDNRGDCATEDAGVLAREILAAPMPTIPLQMTEGYERGYVAALREVLSFLRKHKLSYTAKAERIEGMASDASMGFPYRLAAQVLSDVLLETQYLINHPTPPAPEGP